MGLMVIAPDWTALVYGSPAPLPAPAPHPVPKSLPSLEETPCPRCNGEGFREHYDPRLVEPSHRRCDRCYGRRTVEVCSGCKQVPELKEGLEVCGCEGDAYSALTLGR